MSVQQFPEAVRRARHVLHAAAVLAVAAAGAIVIDQAAGSGLAQRLHDAYPQRSADELALAESSILTYLFTLAALGAALFVAMAWAIRRGHRWVRGVGTMTVLLGSVLAVYNFSQPHPLVMTVAGLLPCAAGATAVVLVWQKQSASHFKPARPTAG